MSSYSQDIYVLPFDHRSSFIKSFIGDLKELDKKQIKLIKAYKHIIYEAFLLSLESIDNPKLCSILVDEQFGSEIIKSALKKRINLCLPVEKSGQKVFSFEHSKNFALTIQKIKPTIVKALVRYNPANIKTNKLQLKKLKKLNDWCIENKYPLMIELLVPPTPANMKRARGKREIYDSKLRTALTLKGIKEFHTAGIEPDIWKIEAFENTVDWEDIIELIRDGDTRDDVAIIMLGRGESFAKVKQWMNIAPRHMLNGFAVGRTVFLRSLKDMHAGKINKKQAIKEISKNYLELIKYWRKK